MMDRLRLNRLQLYGVVSSTCFAWAIINAFRVRSNFYSAAVYLSKSNACMMILWNQAIYQTVLFGKLFKKIFFGQLRMIEVERLQERGWFAVTETLLALTIFKDEFESSFVMLFVSLLFLKVFHWLASDRVEMMEQTAQVTRLAHIRMVGVLSILWCMDAVLLIFAAESILIEGPTVMIMFASEYMIMLANVWTITMKYILNCIDLRSETPWENKSIWGLYVDLTADFFKLVTYVTFFSLILTFYGLPLNILRDVYITLRSFVLKCRDLRRYRAATRNMDTLYPDATLAEMEAMADKTCIICREDMEYRGERPTPARADEPSPGPGQDAVETAAPRPPPPPPAPVPRPRIANSGPNDTPKKLPCGHVFHFHCLKSWLERQQSCPTCRRPVLPSEQPRVNPGAGRAAAANHRRNHPPPAVGDDAIRQAQLNLARNLGREAFEMVFPGIPFPPEAEHPPAPPPATATADSGPSNAAPSPAGARPAQTQGSGQTMDVNADANAAASSSRSESAPAASRPTPTPTANVTANTLPAGSNIAPGSGGLNDNPLARFSLPNVPLPTTGEVGLYGTPSAQAATHDKYANIAYGAFPLTGLAGLPRKGTPALNVTTAPAGQSTVESSASSSVPTTTTAAVTGPDGSTREAVLAAAERRQAAAAADLTTTTATASAASTTHSPASSLASRPPTDARQHSQPRLIPLFDATTDPGTYPHLRAAMPHPLVLPPSMPVGAPGGTRTTAATGSGTELGNMAVSIPLPAAPLLTTSSEGAPIVDEIETITRRGLEARLRSLIEFQTRIEGLVGDMRGALDQWTVDGSHSGGRAAGDARDQQDGEQRDDRDDVVVVEGKDTDKGKRPVEGIHAVQNRVSTPDPIATSAQDVGTDEAKDEQSPVDGAKDRRQDKTESMTDAGES